MKEHTHIKFLTLTARQTLSQQHKQSFKNVNFIYYQDTAGKLKEKNAVTICLNILEKLAI